tara:strand:+ start:695 stop:832 length:138 start_codon:yes stop_codon:yes gene_type:complete
MQKLSSKKKKEKGILREKEILILTLFSSKQSIKNKKLLLESWKYE